MSNPYSSYLSKIRASESSGNDLAHNQYGASGRYQFLPSTWKGMGYNLKDIYNTQLQEEAVFRLTTDNSNYLKKRLGINPTDADLYGAHFLGPAGYAHLYQTADNAPISDVMSAKAINNNPHVKGKTVGFLKNWLAKKMSIKPSASESYASTSEGQDYGYGVDTSINLPTNTGEYQTAPDMAGTSTKEDAEADQAKAALLEKQKEKDFLAEVKARQEQTTELRQQQEQQQDNGLDPSYYQAPQVELPNYEAIKYQQAQNQAQAPQNEFQLGGEKKYSEQNGRLVVTTKIVNTPNGPRFYQAKSPDYNFSIVLADSKRVGDSIPRANLDPHIIEALSRRQEGGQIDLQFQEGGKKEDKPSLGAGKFNTTTGKVVIWGTPEYEKAYNNGEVVTDKGGRSEATLEGGQLDEVVVKGKKRGFWKQSRDKYLKEHQDDGLLGAIGSVATYPLAVGQHALTYATEGKVQDPSEAWGYNTNERWLDSPGAFGRNLADASLNIVADPSNLVGAGIVTKGKGVINALTKGKALSKGIVSYGDDLIQASKIAGKPKLPTYNNAYRWQADVVPESLVNAGKSLTAEQQALTGSWYTHDPNQLPFYMRTRPGSGNVNVSRLSDAKIANLESNMSDAARGMSGKTESVVASNTSLPGELILPKSLKDKVKQFKFDVNPSEYPLPSEQQELLKDPSFIGSNYHRLMLQENTSNIINPILEAQYQPIMGVPRKYFPFKEGGEAVEQFQVGGYSLTPNIPSFDELFEDNTIYKGAPLEEVVIKAPRKKEIVNEKPFSINFDEETLRETQAVRDNIPNKRDLNIGITRYSDQATEDEYIKNQVIASNKLQEQEAAKKAKEFNDFSKELSSKGTLADAVENNEIPLDISSYKTEKDVTNLQKMLKEKGYNLNPKGKFANDGIDGKIGKVTFDAMVNYNKHNSESGYASIKEGTGLIGSCQESQCSEYMQNELFRNVQPKISREDWNKKTGLYGNAWNIGKNIVDSGGSKIQINKVKPGDVITMYTGGISDYQGEANAAGTGTTHTGLVDKINPDGSYYILHNVHDKNYATGDYTGVEYRDLVKDGKIVSGGLMRSFDVKYAFRPDYKEVKLGEKKILNDNIKLTLDPKKAAVLSSEEYDNRFTSANAKNKLLNTFIKPLNDSRNKKVISKVFGLGDDEYQSLAKVTLGVLGQETGFGTNAKYTTGAKEIAASVSKAAGYVPALALANEVLKSTTDTSFIKKDETSKGAGRLKYETNFGSDDLTELGVTEDNFDDEEKAPLTTMYKLATDYKRFLKKGYNKKDAMYRAITVYNVSLGHVSGGKTTEDWAKNYDVDYTNKVLNYSNFFNIGDNKKQYKTTTDELLLHPNVYKWRAKLKKEKKL